MGLPRIIFDHNTEPIPVTTARVINRPLAFATLPDVPDVCADDSHAVMFFALHLQIIIFDICICHRFVTKYTTKPAPMTHMTGLCRILNGVITAEPTV
jgi:hypothetical protein